MARILEGETFSLDSIGYGAFYLLRHKTARRSTFLQGDDAVEFEINLHHAEDAFPGTGADGVLARLWDQCGYGAIAKADDDAEKGLH